jgi:hypothetical protein
MAWAFHGGFLGVVFGLPSASHAGAVVSLAMALALCPT